METTTNEPQHWAIAILSGFVRKKFGQVALSNALLFWTGQGVQALITPDSSVLLIWLLYLICGLITLNTLAFVCAQLTNDSWRKPQTEQADG
jgi:hypothetical protein